MSARLLGVVVVVTTTLVSGVAGAQALKVGPPGKPPGDKPPLAAEPAPPPPEPPPPPYEPRLLRLSEILGTLAYMRDICGAGDGDEWRKRMLALIESEADTQPRKERLAGAFNRGFRGYQITYRSCTASARAIIERALVDGEKVTREIASRYAG